MNGCAWRSPEPAALRSQITGVIFDFNQSNFIRDTCSKCSGRKYAKHMVGLGKMTAFDNTVQTFVPSHLVSETDTCYASVQKRIGHNSHWLARGRSRFLEQHPSPCFAMHGRQGWTSAICLLWLVKGGHHATMLAFEDTETPMCLPKDFNGAPESSAMSHFKNYCFLIFFFRSPPESIDMKHTESLPRCWRGLCLR